MRFVIRPNGSRPRHLLPSTVNQEITQIVDSNDKNLVRREVYRGEYHNSKGILCSHTVDALHKYYHGKCAYCETFAEIKIEHYRPLGKYGRQHTGYLWLCYEWTNLLPACHDCNTPYGAKGSKFPIQGTRVSMATRRADSSVDTSQNNISGPPLLGENAMLLHPELDQPAQFLKFTLDAKRTGLRLLGRDRTGRGKETVSICKLNREPLRLHRLEIMQSMGLEVDVLFGFIESCGLDVSQYPAAFLTLFSSWHSASLNDLRTHTLLRRQALATLPNFRRLLLPFVDPIKAASFLKLFQEYKSGYLAILAAQVQQTVPNTTP
jgi:uncharacterized protein (TIGR02646 family)